MSIDFILDDIPTHEDMLPHDSVPETIDVEYPCEKCGREAGPYSGRGRKPKICSECKPRRTTKSNVPKVTGATANLAAQATEVLSQLNAMIAVGCMAVKMFGTARAIGDYDDTFKAQAHAALITDPELCKFILKGGVKSAKITLALAYGGMAMSVAPTAVSEVRLMRERRAAEKETEY